jgi:hypothetical protein
LVNSRRVGQLSTGVLALSNVNSFVIDAFRL